MKTLIGIFVLCSSLNLNCRVEITGRLVGHNGKPMQLAHVSTPDRTGSLTVVAVADDNGVFRFTTDKLGRLSIVFSGTNHQPLTANLFISESIHSPLPIDVSLAANVRPETIDSVLIIGDFNRFKFETGTKMQRGSDGKYFVNLDTRDDTLKYQILLFHPGVDQTEQHSINGSMSNSYEYDLGGDYRSVLYSPGHTVRVVFDPASMPESSPQPSINIHNEWEQAYVQYRERNADRFRYIWDTQQAMAASNSAEQIMARVTDSVRREILHEFSNESDKDLRRILLMSYLQIPWYTSIDERSKKLAEEILSSVAPDSYLWSDASVMLQTTFTTGDITRYEDYIMAAHKAEKDTNTVPWALLQVLDLATAVNPNADIMPILSLLKRRFPGSSAIDMANKQYDPGRAIMVGKTVPDFSFASLEDSTKFFSRESFKGKYLLIDLWATWCGPCRGEMPFLHAAFDKFHDHNIDFLSISLDGKPEDIAKYRNGKWKMPWHHVFSNGVFKSKAAEIFQTPYIPFTILIAPDSKIIAISNKLRGESLEKTLSETLH